MSTKLRPNIVQAANLIGDPSRLAMLIALLGGNAIPRFLFSACCPNFSTDFLFTSIQDGRRRPADS
ncbi:hypothetical protein MHH56_00625 [Paenibacillus sp. FSL K6-3182]|uniref:hypothetical protein n=1 Tax=Paenibacillus sp. FSL K6-3182 TaxID=2921495 RepID=UPI0030CE5034